MTGMPRFSFDMKAKLKQLFGAAKAASTVEEIEPRRRTECPVSKLDTQPKVKRPISVKGMEQASLARRTGGNKNPSAKVQPSSPISELPYQPVNATPSGLVASASTRKGNGLGNHGESYTKYQATKAKYSKVDHEVPLAYQMQYEQPASVIITKQEREAKSVSVRNAIVNKQVGKHMQALKKVVKPITIKKRKSKKSAVAHMAPVITKKQRKATASNLAANKRANAKSAMDKHVELVTKSAAIEADPFKLKHLRLEREAELRVCQQANLARRGATKVRQDGAAAAALVETTRRKEKREWFKKAQHTALGKLDASVKNKKVVSLSMARTLYSETFKKVS